MRIVAAALIALTAIFPSALAAETDLVALARSGDTAGAIRAIKAGADAGVAAPNGTTALHWAAHNGDVRLVKALLGAGVDPNVRNRFGATPIAEAAVIGSAPIIEALLEAGVDPDTANREGQTPLMTVARTGRVAAAEVLVRNGADVNARENWGGQTALMWAAAQSQPEMVAFLAAHGADLDARGAVRDWTRRMTSEPRKKDMNEGGFTPLLYAAREGCVACARNLVEAGADIDMHDPDRVTPLNLAIQNRNFDLAAYLIEAGADIDKWDFFGRTPLYNAVDMNTIPKIETRPELPSRDDTTALRVIEMLLARGANPNIQLKHRPQYRQAVYERGTDIMLSVGATPLLRAARAADLSAMRLLLAHGAMPELPNMYGVTPFMAAGGVGFGVRATRGTRATEEDRVAALRLLLEAGADVNRLTVSQGRTPPPGMDNFLWRIQIRVNNQRYLFSDVPPDGRNVVHGAARNGWNTVLRFLAGEGARLDVVDVEGRTAMDLAAGRYETPFLVPPADPFAETMALLSELCAAQDGCAYPEPPGDEAGAETAQSL